LHNCAYIELYLGSSRAFSKICNTRRTKVTLRTKNLKLTLLILSHAQFSSVRFGSIQFRIR
jgi:hypothetical protein